MSEASSSLLSGVVYDKWMTDSSPARMRPSITISVSYSIAVSLGIVYSSTQDKVTIVR